MGYSAVRNNVYNISQARQAELSTEVTSKKKYSWPYNRDMMNPLTTAKGTAFIRVPSRYNCIGCSPGKHPDIRMMAIDLDGGSRDNARDRRLRISVSPCWRLLTWQSCDRLRARRALPHSRTEAPLTVRRRWQTAELMHSWLSPRLGRAHALHAADARSRRSICSEHVA